MPYAKPFYHFLIGKYSFASWYTPYKARYATNFNQTINFINMLTFNQLREIFPIRRMPYEINKTPLGFAFVLFGQQIGGLSACMCASLIINLIISLNLYVVAGINDLHSASNNLDVILIQAATRKIKVKIIHCHLIELLSFHWWIIQ